jgi:hypothetical protein
MSDEQQNTRRKVVLPPVDAALRTPRATASEEEAPVEAVRAIAALLGRAATPEVAEPTVSVIGDREVQIQGVIGALNDEQDAEFRDARKRLKRAQRHVEEVLERLAAATPDGLSG